jgi:nucleotide-binding universal stress UspA family protein
VCFITKEEKVFRGQSVVLIPATQSTDVERMAQVASTLAAPHLVQTKVVHVTPPPGSTTAFGDWGARPVDAIPLRGTPERVIPAYAQLIGASAIVVDRGYGRGRLWPNSPVVTRLARWSPVPVLVVPDDGPAIEPLVRGEVKRVVTAVDFSMASAVALKAAAALQRQHDARMTLIHALVNVPRNFVFTGQEALRIVEQLPLQQTRLSELFRNRATRLGHANAEAQVVTGDAARAILTSVTEGNADILVMGVAPRHSIDRWLFGSTLSHVLRRTKIPVLVVPVVGGSERWSDDAMSDVIAARDRQSTLPQAA